MKIRGEGRSIRSEQIEGVCKAARQSDTNCCSCTKRTITEQLVSDRITTNPSKESILIKMEALLNDPEITDIKMTLTIIDNRSQGMRDNVQNY